MREFGFEEEIEREKKGERILSSIRLDGFKVVDDVCSPTANLNLNRGPSILALALLLLK